jgi:hypothetical protein
MLVRRTLVPLQEILSVARRPEIIAAIGFLDHVRAVFGHFAVVAEVCAGELERKCGEEEGCSPILEFHFVGPGGFWIFGVVVGYGE